MSLAVVDILVVVFVSVVFVITVDGALIALESTRTPLV